MGLTAAEIGEKVHVAEKALNAVALDLGASDEPFMHAEGLIVGLLHWATANGYSAERLIELATAQYNADTTQVIRRVPETGDEPTCAECGDYRGAKLHTDTVLHPDDEADGLYLHPYKPSTA